MTPFELDDCMNAVKKTIAFYDKRLTDDQIGFWRAYVKKQDPVMFKRALVEYYETGKFCPKPSDISDVLARLREREMSRRTPEEQRAAAVKPAPVKVAQAWAFWIGVMWESGLFRLNKNVGPAEAMEMLKLINMQAKASGNVEAIAPDFRIRGIWEEGVPEHEIMAILEAGT